MKQCASFPHRMDALTDTAVNQTIESNNYNRPIFIIFIVLSYAAKTICESSLGSSDLKSVSARFLPTNTPSYKLDLLRQPVSAATGRTFSHRNLYYFSFTVPSFLSKKTWRRCLYASVHCQSAADQEYTCRSGQVTLLPSPWYTGWPKKVSHSHEPSLNRIITRY